MIYYRGAPCVDTIFLGTQTFVPSKRGSRRSKSGRGEGGEVKTLRRSNSLSRSVFLVRLGPLGIFIARQADSPESLEFWNSETANCP